MILAKILLADEPVASLDPKNTLRIMDALQKISEDDIAVVVNLHSSNWLNLIAHVLLELPMAALFMTDILQV